jgi:hypothetical protein
LQGKRKKATVSKAYKVKNMEREEEDTIQSFRVAVNAVLPEIIGMRRREGEDRRTVH